MKKFFVLLSVLLASLLCTGLCSCRADSNDRETAEIPQITQESTALSEAEETTCAAAEETTSVIPADTVPEIPEIPEQIPLDIETIGGVVIVGKIAFDDAGWHIIPEQPLNITYEYFLDNPSVFPAQTRIRLIDPRDDGIDKAAYLGQTVTIHGTFRFVRDDFETLYLSPYTITVGKIADQSFGDPGLRAPEGPVDLYDRSKPLPQQMESTIMDGKYTYNPFMLSEESLQLMGNDFAWFYCDFVDALLNYRSEVPCPERSYAEMLGTVIYYDLPIFNACAQPFEFLKHYDGDAGTIRIEYQYSEEEHKTLLAEFFAAANELLAEVTPDMSDVEKAKTIYHALCTRMEYDDSALENFARKDSYFAYLYNSGVCITFANVYNQLLTQVGIKTTLATCDYTATMGHVWSVVTLDGEDYFCDPTFELSHDNGNGTVYFGMNYADRTKEGLGKDGIRVGRYHTYTVLPEMIAAQSLLP